MGGIKEELASQFRSLSVATAISMSVVFSIFAGVITGYYLDKWLFDGRTHWLTLICLALGIAGGVKNFIALSRRFADKSDQVEGRGQPGISSKDHQHDVKGNVSRRSK